MPNEEKARVGENQKGFLGWIMNVTALVMGCVILAVAFMMLSKKPKVEFFELLSEAGVILLASIAVSLFRIANRD